MTDRYLLCKTLALAILTVNFESPFVMGQTSGSLIWSRTRGSFVPLDDIETFKREREYYVRQRHELENHRFGREELRGTYYEESNIVNFYDNDTKVTGVCGELWNLLADYLNFTLVPIKAKEHNFGRLQPDGTYNGLIGMALRNDVEIILRTGYYVADHKVLYFTQPLWPNSFRLYIRPELRHDSTWLMHIFSRKVWFSIFLLFLFLSVMSYAMEKISMRLSGDTHWCHDLHDHFFHTFATFCCQGYVPDSLYRRTKILAFSKKMFAWLLLVTLSSYIISFVTNQKVQPPFRDLDTMFNDTDYNIVVFNRSIVHDKFKTTLNRSGALERYASRIFYVQTTQRLYEKGCWGKRKYAIMDSDDRQRAFGRFKCNLASTGVPFFSTWVAASVAKSFKYKKSLDMGILKLNECGLMDGLKDRWFATDVVNEDSKISHNINFGQVSMLYAILGIGMIASIVIFVLENAVFLYYQNQERTRRTRTFYPRGMIHFCAGNGSFFFEKM